MSIPAPAGGKPRILCVDDDPGVLDGLSLHLGRRYQMFRAESGTQGLAVLHVERDIAVVISDMRMPLMDGATFLSKARKLTPDSVRLLLTGQTDIESAIAAVNEGQIFRFLTKPTPPNALLAAVEAALEQHRLITSERVLLQQTLLGSMKTLSDVLALTSPVAFGRSMRVRQLVCAMAEHLGVEQSWRLEMAAMFSQLGSVSLPDATLERMCRGERLDDGEQAMVTRANQLTDQLLGNIPRLEGVRSLLAAAFNPAPSNGAPTTAQARALQRGGDLIRLALEFDTLECEGNESAIAINTIRGRGHRYEPDMLAALQTLRGGQVRREEVRELRIAELRPGMVFMEDVKLRNGVLLVARGYEVTPSFLARVRNHEGNVHQPVRVLVPPPGSPLASAPASASGRPAND
jgi:response regulator RpfG family c-di-GMP phosphodiesterase